MKVFILLINLVFLSSVAYVLWKRESQNALRRFFWPAMVFKLAAGIGLGLTYLHYYTAGDTFLFFADAKRLTEFARDDFFAYVRFLYAGDETAELSTQLAYSQYRALFMVKVASIFSLITFDNYWIITLYFSLASFICAWTLVKVIAESFPLARVGAVVGFLFFPSVVFWSSGLIKESLAMAALFLLCAQFIKVWTRQPIKWVEWILILVSAWFLWRLKYYYLAVFLPVAISAFITHRLSEKLKLKRLFTIVLLWCTTFIVPVAIVSSLRPNFYPHRILDVIVLNNQEFNNLSAPEDVIAYEALEPSVVGISRNIPLALISGIFRPFPWEAHTLFQWMIAVENTVLLILFLFATANALKLVRSRERLLLCSLIVYVVSLCVFLALSTPNFGTLSRYRISFLPFFFLLITIENPLMKRLTGFIQR